MDQTIDFVMDDTGESGTLIIQGPLTVVYVKGAKTVLLEALKDVTNLTIDLDGLTDADLTTLQLLCSAHRYCFSRNKKISIKGKCPAALRQVMDDSGYQMRAGCDSGTAETCLWATSHEQEVKHE